MNRTNWKIAEESKQHFVEGLLIAMKQYDYKQITVTLIAQEAGLSRKTFYRLFHDRYDVLNLLFENLSNDCIAMIKSKHLHRYWDIVQIYFDYWEERKSLLELLLKNNLLSRLFDFLYQHSFDVFEYARSKDYADNYSLPLPYLLAYSTGGIHCMLIKWIEQGMVISSSELIEKLKAGFMSPDI